MGTTFIKPKANEDFYVLYSSVVDSPVGSGSRAEFEADEYWQTSGVLGAERFERADAYGTSARWGSPRAYDWTDPDLMVREGVSDPTRPESSSYGLVKREDLRKFCESVGDDGMFHPEPGLVEWVVVEDEA